MAKKLHRGLALAKKFHDAQDRTFRALETINRDSEKIGDLGISTMVDHENRLEALETELKKTRRDLALAVNAIAVAIETCPELALEGLQFISEGLGTENPETESQPPKSADERRSAFEVHDGDLKGEA